LQAESVEHHLRVRVLLHSAPKPAYASASAARTYFASLPEPVKPHELIVVGDRVFTDVVLARRLAQPPTMVTRIKDRINAVYDLVSQKERPRANGPLAVLTTGLWERENLPLRWIEGSVVRMFEHFVPAAKQEREELQNRFLRRAVKLPKPGEDYVFGKPWQWAGRQ